MKYSILLLLWIGLGPVTGQAAVVPDDESQGTCSCTSLTVSHTVGTGSERFMKIQVMFFHNGTHSVSGVTYGGVAATFVDQTASGGCAGFTCVIQTWQLIAPASGTANIVVNSSGNYEISLIASSWSGVDQTTPLGTVVKGAGFGSAPSIVVSSSASEVVSGAVMFGSTSGLTPSGGATQLAALLGAAGYTYGAASYMAGAASTTYGWTYSTSQNYAISAVAIKPSTGGGGSGGGGTTFFTETLLWTDNANNETHFELEWKHATLPTYTRMLFLAPNTVSYTVQYTTETSRCYRIRAGNGGGNSAYSNELCSTTVASGPILPTLTAPNIGGGAADD